MKILIINAGSSSLKYQLIDMDNENVLAKGNAERIGIKDSLLTHEVMGKEKFKISKNFNDHTEAIKEVIKTLISADKGVITDMSEIGAVGHRVVHGGERFKESVLIDDEVMDAIRANIDLAPLHNPANIMGIEACMKIMPGVPMSAVFDTAFHQTMPREAFLYAIPYESYLKHGIRRYGFHGTSHKYVSLRAAQILNRPIEELKIVTCHLGNGSSIAAVKHGKSIDTSMGFTPLDGLPMGTRSGSIDPAIVSYLMEKEDLTIDETSEYLNKQSGVLGISGVSSDFRDLADAAADNVERAKLALEVFNYQVKKYIGEYAAAMGGIDCVVFTAGIGENTPAIREESCQGLEFLGIKVDPVKNNSKEIQTSKEGIVSTDDTPVKVLVVPTNEELMIARETINLLK
ncbi:MAG: acetate kinase [Clostridia bacterium]|jgi:acetate kinase|nr:acetate kinase [Clostridia bacterium]MDI9511609.1 acetate kinase [Bacillota bacterium]